MSVVVTSLLAQRDISLQTDLQESHLAPLFDDVWTGAMVWPCSHALCDVLETQVAPTSSSLVHTLRLETDAVMCYR